MKMNLFHFPEYYSSRLYIILSVFALSLGGTIYIFFRTSEHVFFGWIRAVGLDHWFNLVRDHSLSSSLFIPEWFIFSLPNGLWAFAYALLITSIWSGSKSWLRHLWMASIPILVLGFEVLQYAAIIHGTFSIQDLVFGMAGLIVGIIIGTKIIKPDNHEKASE